MTTHAMIDLETLSTRPDATVITVGAIKFNPFDDSEPHSGLYLRLNVDEQGELGRHVDDNTMAWWSRQKKEIQDEAFGDHERTSVMEAIKQINKFSVGVDEFWCQGPLFDYAILQHLYKQMETPVPWNYWQIRDSRTVFNMMPQDPRKGMQTDLHNALADCYFQAKCLQKVYKTFGVTKK